MAARPMAMFVGNVSSNFRVSPLPITDNDFCNRGDVSFYYIEPLMIQVILTSYVSLNNKIYV